MAIIAIVLGFHFLPQFVDSIRDLSPRGLSIAAAILSFALFIISCAFSFLAGIAASRKKTSESFERLEKLSDHLRQMTLNTAVAFIAVITATFAISAQQRAQTINQVTERLQIIDATLATKLDSTLNTIARLYFTQAIALFEDYQANAGRGSDIDAWRVLSTALNEALAKAVIPPITEGELPNLVDAFSLRGGSSSPFLYGYLTAASVDAISIHERHIAINLAALARELHASRDGDGLPAIARNTKRDSNTARRYRIARTIEELKTHVAIVASYICVYKSFVARKLDDRQGDIYDGQRIHLKSFAGAPKASEFIGNNEELLSARVEGVSCSERLLRSIVISYNTIIGRTRLFDFLQDLYDLKDQEYSISRRLETMRNPAAARIDPKPVEPGAK